MLNKNDHFGILPIIVSLTTRNDSVIQSRISRVGRDAREGLALSRYHFVHFITEHRGSMEPIAVLVWVGVAFHGLLLTSLKKSLSSMCSSNFAPLAEQDFFLYLVQWSLTPCSGQNVFLPWCGWLAGLKETEHTNSFETLMPKNNIGQQNSWMLKCWATKFKPVWLLYWNVV